MISDFDRENVGLILRGYGDWFGAKLLRLYANADTQNRDRIAQGFPDYAEAYNTWFNRDADAHWDDRPVNPDPETYKTHE